jgi:hypothetical protein
MNYYTIEYFKHYLKDLNSYIKRADKIDLSSSKQLEYISNRINEMLVFVEDRETNNAHAYSSKHMHKPDFK